MSVSRAALDAAAREFYVSDHEDRAWAERAWADMGGSEPSDERAYLEISMGSALAAAIPHLTPEDVPHIVAQVLRDAADEAEAIIADGDVAEVAALVPGERGRGAVIAARDALCEEPVEWLRARADRLDPEAPQ